MNDKMAELLNRRAKAKDWASDGRRAAGMIFGAIAAMSTAEKSFALLLLAGKFFPSWSSLIVTAPILQIWLPWTVFSKLPTFLL